VTELAQRVRVAEVDHMHGDTPPTATSTSTATSSAGAVERNQHGRCVVRELGMAVQGIVQLLQALGDGRCDGWWVDRHELEQRTSHIFRRRQAAERNNTQQSAASQPVNIPTKQSIAHNGRLGFGTVSLLAKQEKQWMLGVVAGESLTRIPVILNPNDSWRADLDFWLARFSADAYGSLET
jgi:hypothetical protein